MKPKLEVVFLITQNFDKMLIFYRDVMGFNVKQQMDNFVEFENEGVRFEMSTSEVMKQTTGDKSYLEKRKGQSFELAFLVDDPVMVDSKFEDIVEKGATLIKAPEDKPWNQRAGFFADPDGNIHEIYADIQSIG